METTASEIGTPPEPPIRILVQTLTHLVPGKGEYERTFFILNHICQYHWKCDFEVPRFRWKSYNTQFAFNNRRCFFVVDHGESENDDDVPVLSYEWTGETLKSLPQLTSDPKIQSVLKEQAPFTWRPKEKEKIPVPKLVKLRLHDQAGLSDSELNHMREHEDDQKWLKAHLRPRLWNEFVREANARRRPGDPIITE